MDVRLCVCCASGLWMSSACAKYDECLFVLIVQLYKILFRSLAQRLHNIIIRICVPKSLDTTFVFGHLWCSRCCPHLNSIGINDRICNVHMEIEEIDEKLNELTMIEIYYFLSSQRMLNSAHFAVSTRFVLTMKSTFTHSQTHFMCTKSNR